MYALPIESVKECGTSGARCKPRARRAIAWIDWVRFLLKEAESERGHGAALKTNAPLSAS